METNIRSIMSKFYYLIHFPPLCYFDVNEEPTLKSVCCIRIPCPMRQMNEVPPPAKVTAHLGWACRWQTGSDRRSWLGLRAKDDSGPRTEVPGRPLQRTRRQDYWEIIKTLFVRPRPMNSYQKAGFYDVITGDWKICHRKMKLGFLQITWVNFLTLTF